MELTSAAKAIGVILAVVVVGRYLLNGVYRLVARTRVKEAMTASALLTVVGVTLVMQLAGLPASLGAFLAGVLLANSDYRHEIVADIAPFEGLLLGLFFTAIGMSLNLSLSSAAPIWCWPSWPACWPSRPCILFVPGAADGPGVRAGAPARARPLAGRRVRLRAVRRRRHGGRAGASRSPTCCRSPSRCPWPPRRCCC